MLLEQQQKAAFERSYPGALLELRRDNACTVSVKPGKKFTKVDIGSSGRYIVDNTTGEIFGIKAYGVIHRGRRYGTLDTIHDWDWSDYYAQRKAVAA